MSTRSRAAGGSRFFAPGLLGLLMASGCRSSTPTLESGETVERTQTEDALAAPADTAPPIFAPSGSFLLDTVIVDAAASDGGPNCSASGDPTTGMDAGPTCTGALAASVFQNALCSCTTLAASGQLTTDGYDSTKGSPNGGLGGNIGVDTSASWSNQTSIGGAFLSPGGVQTSASSVVRGDLRLGGTLTTSAPFTVDGNAYVVKTLPSQVKVLGSTSHVASVPAPCDCTNVLSIASIVAAHRSPNNDDSAIGLSPNAAVGSTATRIDLSCGNYYLSQINISQALSIAVHGHTALYVDGNVNASNALTLQIDPTATLDFFVAGTFSASGAVTLGSSSAPAHCRAYVAGASLSISASANVDCNVYAPNASVNLSGTTATYGAVFAHAISTSGNVVVHYDTSIQNAGGECCTATSCDDGNPCTSDACNGDGTCGHTPVANGTSCPAGSNKCEQSYTCQAGACVGSNPVTCTAQDQCHGAGTCNAVTGACSNPVLANGTTCNDGNACTQTDTCQAGACTGSNPVTCTAEDQCHSAGTCNPTNGTCSNPALANGTACNDGNACTLSDSCQSGSCVGSNPVMCVAADQCHVAGVCNPSSGACSTPPAPNGTACNDGNACTQVDTCQVGACTGTSPVVCTASDQCHVAGTCNPSTGACSNPAATNGTACNDGNACTRSDSCQNGTCAGSNPVTCTASDQCHGVGTCNPASGACSNPALANGTACSDGNACTQTDSCQSGTCVGANPVTCIASDQCHVAGTCNPSTGACSNPAATNGTACNDGNACTQSDSCQSGACAGSNPVTCTASDQCHGVGTCNPASGACSNPALANGTACSDGNACTQADSCQSGTCVGANPVTCTASDQCHVAGSCNPSTGACSNPAATDGTSCNDGNACTQVDTCQSGVCSGGNPVACTTSDQCHGAGTCDPTTGVCSNPALANGTSCNDGNGCTLGDACQGGTCVSGTPVVCAAPDGCHVAGTCDPTAGTCTNVSAPDGTPCGAAPCVTAGSCTSGVCTGAAPVVCSGGPQAQFASTGPMSTARTSHAMASLPSGDVLATGGQDATTNVVATAEIYRAATQTWVAAAPMSYARNQHTLLTLSTGKVLAAGGYDENENPVLQAEIYDPVSDSWSPSATMNAGHAPAHAVQLPSGDVVITGWGSNAKDCAINSELYSSATNAWTVLGTATNPGQCGQVNGLVGVLVELPSGMVIAMGDGTPAVQTYVQGSPGWTQLTTMPELRYAATAAALPNGTVLFAGGYGNGYLFDATIFDPVLVTWTPAGSMGAAHVNGVAATLANGDVLVSAGTDPGGDPGGDLYSFATGSWETISGGVTRSSDAAVAMKSGSILLSGGYDITVGGATPSADIFSAPDAQCAPASQCNPATGQCSAATAVADGTSCNDGSLCTSGDSCRGGYCVGSPLLCPSSACQASECNAVTGACLTVDTNEGLACGSGPCIASGSCVSGECAGSAPIVCPGPQPTFTPTAPMEEAREGHVATELANGDVLVTGGHQQYTDSFTSAEIYHAGTRSWSQVAPMNVGRAQHTAVRLSDGRILVAGGIDVYSDAFLPSAEIYDPAADTWTPTGSMTTAMQPLTSVLLGNGQVIVIGNNGTDAKGCAVSSELYDPPSGVWAPVGAASNPSACSRQMVPGTEYDVLAALPSGGALAFGSVFALYAPGSSGWVTLETAPPQPADFAGLVRTTGKLLFTGGYDPVSGLGPQYAYLWDSALNTWAATGGPVPGASFYNQGTPTPSGDLFFGAQLYSASTGTFSSVSWDTQIGNGAKQSAVSLGVLLTGGMDNNTEAALATAVLFSAQDAQCTQPSSCDPASGQCSPLVTKADGTTCSDGNLCMQAEACQSGYCIGSNPVTCPTAGTCQVSACNPSTGTCATTAATAGEPCADDGNPCTADICASDGTCAHPPIADGTSCPTGADACNQTYTCLAGACVGSNPVVCVALDQCHPAGQCQPATGACTNPAAPDGTTCNDGNACTQTDACIAGVCAGTNPVVCAASDQCHVPGECQPATGTCTSSTPAPNGTVCNDGNACTQTDTCTAGVCTGSNFAQCKPTDTCHGYGTCNPATGACSNPALADGTGCNDGNACTQNDGCIAGQCVGSNPIVCTASDQCHAAGTCDPTTGACSNPAIADGTLCNDRNACTQTDVCQGGTCVGSNPLTCPPPPDVCHLPTTCDSYEGCLYPPAPNGTACPAGDNKCDQIYSCSYGTCVGSNPIACPAPDSCHEAGNCDPGTGQCSYVAIPDGQACTSNNKCYGSGIPRCAGGACLATTPVTCTASDQCHVVGTCDPTTGACSNPAATNGTACNTFVSTATNESTTSTAFADLATPDLVNIATGAGEDLTVLYQSEVYGGCDELNVVNLDGVDQTAGTSTSSGGPLLPTFYVLHNLSAGTHIVDVRHRGSASFCTSDWVNRSLVVRSGSGLASLSVPTDEVTTSAIPTDLATPDRVLLELPAPSTVSIFYEATVSTDDASSNVPSQSDILVVDGAPQPSTASEYAASGSQVMTLISATPLSAGFHTVSVRHSVQGGRGHWQSRSLLVRPGSELIAASNVPTDEATSSTSYTDLATPDTATFTLLAPATVDVWYAATKTFPDCGETATDIINVDGTDFPQSSSTVFWSAATSVSALVLPSLGAGAHVVSVHHKVSITCSAHWRNRSLLVELGDALSSSCAVGGCQTPSRQLLCDVASCDDGNPCTIDTCDDDAGCEHLPAADGGACSGANLCNQTYACLGGACVGSNPVTCTASDPCAAGHCDPTTGTCSGPAMTDGTACTTTAQLVGTCASASCQPTCTAGLTICGSSCANLQTDVNNCGACGSLCSACSSSCAGGACTPACTASSCDDGNPCTVDACDSHGGCTHKPVSDGTACNDGNACTLTDTCQVGTCVGANPVSCTATDSCHVAACNPATGACSNSAVTCTPSDQCHIAGVCDATSGVCSNPAAADGTTCDDGSDCTRGDSCKGGTCAAGAPVACTASDSCHIAGACDQSGKCPIATGASCAAAQVTSGPVTGSFFVHPLSQPAFAAQRGATPAFVQTFPNLNFNPPAGFVQNDTSGTGPTTHPFTDVTTDAAGNFTGTIVAQGNGLMAGVGALGAFDAVFTSQLIVAHPGDFTFNVVADDGFLIGIGGNAHRVNGAYVNAPPSNVSAFESYPLVGASNHLNSGLGPQAITVHFPAAGTYPYELDYFETFSSCGNQLSLTLAAAQFVADTSPLSLYVGYADGTRPAGTVFPFPWNGSQGVTYVGDSASTDTGALRFDNNSSQPITLDKVTVDLGTTHLDIWEPPFVTSPIVVQPQGITILAQTDSSTQNFDTSDMPITCTPTGIIPQVHVTVGGVTTSYADTAQVLNTGGIDPGTCTGSNESAPWTRIGGTGAAVDVPLPAVGTLALTPSSAKADSLGSSETLNVVARDASGNAVAGLPITVGVFGVNTRTLSATTDATGTASVGYYGLQAGADTVWGTAFVEGLREVSNSVSINWTHGGGTGGGDGGVSGDAGSSGGGYNGPVVSVGPTGTMTVQAPATNVPLPGSVTDPGLPPGVPLEIQWYTEHGPAAAIFADTGNPGTTATFPVLGVYTLFLAAADGLEGVSNATLTVNVVGNQAPVVSAGPSQTLTAPTFSTTLSGSASDDGEPVGAALTSNWTLVSGPTAVSIATPTQSSVPEPGPLTASTKVTFNYPGVYVLQLAVSDTDLVGTATTTVTVNPPSTTSTNAPTVSYGGIADDALITKPTPITATISEGSWVLDTHLGGRDDVSTPYTVLASGTGPVNGATVATLDPTLLLNGIYTVRLSAQTTAGETSQSFSVSIDGRMKVGNFTLDFTDLQTAVVGVPFTIDRLYDSRDKTVGDFGVGWKLALSDVRVEKSGKTGAYWGYQVNDQGFFTEYCLQNTQAASVAITFPNGRQYRFAPVDPLGCLILQQDTTPDIAWQATSTEDVNNPTVKLVAVNETSVFATDMGPAGVQLLTDEGDIWDPRQFTLTTEDGSTYQIDQDKGVTQVSDRLGNTLSVTPGGIISSSGKQVLFTRDDQQRITTITDPGGQVMTYGYDTDGDLASYTDRAGNLTQFAYSANHYLQDIEDPLGRHPIRNDYDDNGRLLSTTDAAGNTVAYTATISSNLEQVADRLGHLTFYQYNDRGDITEKIDPTGAVWNYTFDIAGNKLSETDPLGHTTSSTYDGYNDPIVQTDALGNVTTNAYNLFRQLLTTTDSLGRVTTNAYDTSGELIRTTDPTAAVTQMNYCATDSFDPSLCPAGTSGNPSSRTDALGNVTTYAYDAYGNVVQTTDPLGHVTSNTYDMNGKKLTETVTQTTGGVAQTLTTSYAYDANGRLTQSTYPDGSTRSTTYTPTGQKATDVDELGRTTTYGYDVLDRLVTTTHPDGTTETQTYDAESRRLTSTDAAGNTTSYAYDNVGRLTKTTFADGSATTTTYDAAGHAIASIDELGHATQTAYDADGRQVSTTDATGAVTQTAYDAAGNATSTTDPLGHVTNVSYDADNRPVITTYPDTTAAAAVYDASGRMTAKIDQLGRTTTFGYDALGRLTSVTDAVGQVTTYAYDELGHRVAQTDANLHTTSFAYDTRGRETQRVLPDGSTENKGYDGAGEITKRTDFIGKVTSYTYDALGRLTSRKYPDGSTVGFTYTPDGRRAGAVDGRGTTSYAYDSRRRLMQETYPDGRVLAFAYDAHGDRTGLTATIGGASLTTSTSYDADSRPSGITDLLDRSFVLTYDLAGNRTRIQYPNTTSTTYGYDLLNRPTSLTTTQGPGPSPLTVQLYAYVLDAEGKRSQVTEADGTVRAYGYDGIDRLTSETVTGSFGYAKAFTYDPVGNRLTQTTNGGVGGADAGAPSGVAGFDASTDATSGGVGGTTVNYSYDTRDRLTTENTIAYAYDSNGNVTGKTGEASYGWDFENRLISLQPTAGGNVANMYDPDGNRVQTAVTPSAGTPVTSNYLVDTSGGLSQVVAETDANGNLTAYYLRVGDELLAVMRPGATAGTWSTRFVHSDGLGSVRVLTDETGATIDQRAYEAFGTKNVEAGSDPLAYGFAGEPFEPVSKLAYHRARWMDARVGRFEGMDPERGDEVDPLSLTPFIYAESDPVNGIDPTGLDFDLTTSFAVVSIINVGATLGEAVRAIALAATVVCTAEVAASAIGNDPTNSPCQVFWVRLQAQGPATVRDFNRGGAHYNEINVEEWIGPRPTFPATVAEGLTGLTNIEARLTKDQLKDRRVQFARARRFIQNAPPGGVGPPGYHSGNDQADAVRVDVVIRNGINFRN
jgi:RHS repeat-associated protein